MTDGSGSIIRRVASGVGLLVLAACLVIAADLFGTRAALFGSATPPPRASAFRRVDSSGVAQKSVLRSQPWWQQVGRYRGTGTSGAGLRRTAELTRIPAEGLQVQADGRWTVRVEQQVDVPLVEPPLAAMTAAGASTIATGGFYRIDQVGRGRATIYRLATGRYALRLDDFYVSANIDLEIRLSTLRTPRTTRRYLSTPARLVAPLDVTTGSMNFLVPRGVDPRRHRSIVIWCPIISSAYAGATLDQRQAPTGRAA